MTKSRRRAKRKCKSLTQGLSAYSIACAAPQLQTAFMKALTPNEKIYVLNNWKILQQEYQKCPDESEGNDWKIWLFLGGRGTGKTRTGAEWVRERVKQGAKRIALIAPGFSDAREVMIEGESGLCNIGFPSERPHYQSSRHRLVWPNGAVAHIFSAEDPDGLRGPQFEYAWADEFCAWNYAEDTLSNLRFALRLGKNPKLVITTTPKPIKALLNLIEQDGVIISKAKTSDNKAFLADGFLQAVHDIYGGTRLGRQELDGEILQSHEGALFNHDIFDKNRVKTIPEFNKIVIAIDPPATSGKNADACGLIVAGRTGSGSQSVCTILHDGTVQGLSPKQWAKKAVELWHGWDGDYILAEVNQGGEMVKSILSAINCEVPIRTVYASKSKTARAEPVAALYEQGRVKHFGCLSQLEDELCALGSETNKSPDRADALVWAVTDLLLSARPLPKMRIL